jgi:hypothetical protein
MVSGEYFLPLKKHTMINFLYKTDKFNIIIIIIIIITPWSRVLLEKLTGFQVVKKFPTFYATRKFITVFTSARHLSL